MIAVADYGVGNLNSVDKALRFIGCDAKITSDPKTIERSAGVVLPGVGAFTDAMESLKRTGLGDVIKSVAESGKPLLGICLGLQLMFECSEESTRTAEGLGLFKGTVKRFPSNMGLKVPHMGWSSITFNKRSYLFSGFTGSEYLYFVHSYYATARDRDISAARCGYGVEFDAAIESGNISATQFHPEKSGSSGLRVLQNWAEKFKLQEPTK